ncbi:hypothetical protein HMPREF9123_1027 [Neisseria bacilliformis ATCC BAA-1200]|uniref:Uncharacterized protein n=1 Tax=Neisseria bacilliformis ATCC BAA-1200 TaxID=888742 RepID=F2BBC2_9NEIS|nr:hypothetical protein HMPREF9123_1027 [Neisseria bacilliformis ATCC BAA-1200]
MGRRSLRNARHTRRRKKRFRRNAHPHPDPPPQGRGGRTKNTFSDGLKAA